MAGGMSTAAVLLSGGFMVVGIWYYKWGYRMAVSGEAGSKSAAHARFAADDALAAALELKLECLDLYDTAKALMDRAEGI